MKVFELEINYKIRFDSSSKGDGKWILCLRILVSLFVSSLPISSIWLWTLYNDVKVVKFYNIVTIDVSIVLSKWIIVMWRIFYLGVYCDVGDILFGCLLHVESLSYL